MSGAHGGNGGNAMNGVGEFAERIRDDQARIGASLPVRLGIVVLALILNIGFYLPRVPGAESIGVSGVDKVVHVLVFALTVWAAGRLLAPVQRFPVGWVVLVALVHAVLIEVVQLAVLPQRSGSVADLIADVIGIALGVAAWRVEQRRTNARRAREAF